MYIATGLLCLLSFLPQAQSSDRTVALIFKDRIEIVKESDARAEYEQLLKVQTQTPSADARFVALVAALRTLPEPAKCITWEQYVAEVTSWWAAPERVYVPCDDPRVGPPKNGRKN